MVDIVVEVGAGVQIVYSPLAVAVRAATQQYRSLPAATAAGYVVQATPCVSDPDHGAMGIHYDNPTIASYRELPTFVHQRNVRPFLRGAPDCRCWAD
jgi:hypothetical protein